MKGLYKGFTALVAFNLTACASVGDISAEYQKTALSKYSELPVSHFVDKMNVKDDALETEAVFNTRTGSRPNPSRDPYLSLISNRNDEFMRAIVPKSGGDIIYQMYFSLQADDWRQPYQINFGEPLGSKAIKRIAIDANCTGGSCTNFEDATVTLTSAELDQMIAHLEANNLPLLRFRVKSQSDRDYDSAFSKAELQAIRQVALKRSTQ